MLNIVVKVDTLVLFLILGAMLSVFHIEDNVCCRLIIYGLYYVEVGSLYAHFLKSFNHKSVLNFFKGFFCIYRDYWRRRWHPTPVLLPGKSHGWRSLVGCSPWGRTESDTTERLHFHFSLSCIGEGNGNPLQCSCLENPRDREPGGLLSMGSHRVRHD